MNWNALSQFEADTNTPQYAQLAARLREWIVSGRIPAGSPLPALREIAALSSTNYSAAQMAAEELARDGFIFKRRGRNGGMFVRRLPEHSETIAILLMEEAAYAGGNIFNNTLVDLLSAKLETLGYRAVIWHDRRAMEERGTIPPILDDALKAGRVQALLLPNVPDEAAAWVSRLAIPYSTVSRENMATPDLAPLVEVMKHRTFRKMRLITSGGTGELRDDPLVRAFAAFGMRITPEQIVRMPGGRQTLNRLGRCGYEATKALLAEKECPDLLVVFPDHAALGAAQAIAEIGVQVPGEMVAAFHRNREFDHFFSFPVIPLDVSIDHVADMLIERLLTT